MVPSHKANDAIQALQKHVQILREPMFEIDGIYDSDKFIQSEDRIMKLNQEVIDYDPPETRFTINSYRGPLNCTLLSNQLILCK